MFHLPFSDLLAADPSEYAPLVAAFHWDSCDRSDTGQLRDLLRHWEEKAAGVTPAHHDATRRLRALGGWRLCLKNPTIHDADLTCFALHPNGELFATGNFAGYGNSTGPFVVWEMETGRCLLDVPLESGPGYPGREGGIQWAPKEEALGFTFQMGWMGAMNPFRGGASEELYLGESMYDEGAAFCWMPDGESLFVAAFPPKDEDEDDDDYDDEDDDDYDEDNDGEETPRGFWWSYVNGGEVSGFDDSANAGSGIPHLDVCRAYGPTIIGVGHHGSTLYALSQQKGLFHSEKADRIWLGMNHVMIYGDGKLKVIDGQSVQALHELPVERPRFCTSTGSADGCVLLVERSTGLEVFRGGNRVAALTSESGIAEAPWTSPDLHSCALSPDGRTATFLTGDRHVEVWQLDGNTECVYRGHFPLAQGVFLNNQGILVLAAPRYIAFIDHRSGRLLSEHYLERPANPSLIQAKKDGPRLIEYPSCAVMVNGQPEWAYVFENGSVAMPAGLNADEQVSYVADERWAWPLRWGDMPIHETLAALCKDPRNGLEPKFAAFFAS